MLAMPMLETKRLLIRPFVAEDLDAVHRMLDVELNQAETGNEGALSSAERARWLQWTILGYEQLAQLNQPPYGDRAVLLKSTEQLIGAIGYVPCLAPFEQMPGFAVTPTHGYTPEVGLFYAISPLHQKRGYATEAARTLIEYAFENLKVKRIIATTTHDNLASIKVMRKLEMRIETNPFQDPAWLQVVGRVERSN